MGFSELLTKLLFARKIEARDGQLLIVGVPMLITPVTFFAYSLLDAFEKNTLQDYYKIWKRAVNETFSADVEKQFGLKRGRLADWLRELGGATGWGQIDFVTVDYEKHRGIVRVKNNPVAMFLSHKVNKPICYHMAALGAGVASRSFEEEVDCVEVKCMALGNPYCEFIIKPKEEIENEKIRKSFSNVLKK